MFGCRNHMLAVNSRSFSLKCLDAGDPHPGDQIRVFTVGFLGPPPARFAGKVEVRPEHLVAAASSRFQCDHAKDSADQLRIPTAGERDWLRETGALLRHVAV